MNDDLQQTVKKHRSSVITGGIIGLVLIGSLVSWRVYESMMTLEPPNIQTAPAAEVVAFIGNKRGLASLSQIEQERYLQKWQEHTMQPAQKEELKKCLTALDERQTKDFIKQILRYIKARYIQDAQICATTYGKKDGKRSAFLREKVAQYDAEGQFIKEVSTCLKASKADFTSEKVQEWVMGHTTPEERDIGKFYFDALDSVRKQMKAQQRGEAAGSKTPDTMAGTPEESGPR